MSAYTLNLMSHSNRNLLYFILLICNHKMSLFANFSYSQIAPHTCLSQIHLHDTLRTFISNYRLLVSTFTLTNTGESQSIRIIIPYTRFYRENIKRDSLKISSPKFSRYFCKLFLSSCKFKSATVYQIAYRIISQLSLSHSIATIPFPISTQVCLKQPEIIQSKAYNSSLPYYALLLMFLGPI